MLGHSPFPGTPRSGSDFRVKVQGRFAFVIHNMNFLRRAALTTSYRLSANRRQRRLEQLGRLGKAPMSVLFYHRVAPDHPNDWTIAPDQFERHITYIRERFDLIGLDELQRRLRDCDSERPSVTITFDDGYADNCQFALPLLIRHRIPTVYFVSTVHVDRQLPFGHDVAAGQPLRVNSVEQLQAAAAGGVEIGLHTANHCNFNCVQTEEQLQEEITEAKQALEKMIDGPVRYLAVPFGMPEQMRPAVFRAAYECGLSGVCSGFGGYNEVGQDGFHIRRIHGDPQFIRLQNWLSYDQRKVRRTPMLPSSDRIPPTVDWLRLNAHTAANTSSAQTVSKSGPGLA